VFHETSVRSVAKAMSWRALGTVVTIGIVWIFTRRLLLAAGVGGVEVLAKMLLFYLHERAWDRVRMGRRRVEPAVIWFTGLSGAGKTTLARYVEGELNKRGWPCELLDGDAIRNVFPSTGFSRSDRHAHVCRVGFLASRLESHGVFAIAALISPYAESRRFVRGLCRRFLEIHVSTPLSECERRDVKGLYARVRAGELKGFTGIDDPYEAPVAPDLTIDTSSISLEEAGATVLRLLTSPPARTPPSPSSAP
jgi:adenylylsulfate kinase